jgi:excisionase family DNA binding protein
MSSDQVPIYVRLAADSAERLERAVSTSGRSKRSLIDDAVRTHLTDDGLVVGQVSLREEAPLILTLDEAAELLRLDGSVLHAAAESGKIPGRRIGDQWRFSRAALLDWLNATPAAR